MKLRHFFLLITFLGNYCLANDLEQDDLFEEPITPLNLTDIDKEVLEMVPKDDKYTILYREDDMEAFNELKASYKKKCDNENDAIACHLFSVIETDYQKNKGYLDRACSIGSLKQACDKILQPEKESGRISNYSHEVEQGMCLSGASYYRCSTYLFNLFPHALNPKENYFDTFDGLYRNTFNAYPYYTNEYSIKKFIEKYKKEFNPIDDETFEMLSNHIDTIHEVIDNAEFPPILKPGNGFQRTKFDLGYVYDVLAFLHFIMDETETAVDDLAMGCKLINYQEESFTPPICTKYIQAIQDNVVEMNDFHKENTKKLCDIAHDDMACAVMSNLEKR